MKCAAILAALCVSACAAPAPRDPPGYHPALSAWRECGGAARESSRTALTTEWPFSLRVATQLRCMGTGRMVGPYYYKSAD